MKERKEKERNQGANNKKSAEFRGHFLVVGIDGEKEPRDSASQETSIKVKTRDKVNVRIASNNNLCFGLNLQLKCRLSVSLNLRFKKFEGVLFVL
ncbi:hypothetical protein M0804_000480 [Polistes exclamans]|nr:hypothetical protein M0804_000480 [Polistes exclamans]